ncbi:MAG TPA: PilT/PilU family type 4a pilus ATPase [Verrucomicrobiota bacterium]|nr:PilT/PilU family type 4a pilus ATPase [Verrucomicrobiota bacterium]
MNTESLESLVTTARQQGASDLHLEPGLPPAFRVRGALRVAGEPLPAAALEAMALEIVGTEHWHVFEQKRSFDCSRTIGGVRCRLNILHSARGVGLAIRLLASFQATIERLNLHPDLKKLVVPTHGLVLISGPTGSGKSSTLAALIHEINVTEARHVVTIESPIEYTFRPRRAFIRQREVGRDTPSFEQALLDAMREDPDVLMVGEMRDPETMRLTLNVAETGHLVFATVHSGSCAEALQRIVLAFPAEIQNNICAQLADCLVAVVCQRLRFRADLGIRLPECEILRPTMPVKAFIRNREFFRIPQALETGAEHDMWTFDRYQKWMAKQKHWHIPSQADESPDTEPVESIPAGQSPVPAIAAIAPKSAPSSPAPTAPDTPKTPKQPIEIEPVEGGIQEVLRKLK